MKVNIFNYLLICLIIVISSNAKIITNHFLKRTVTYDNSSFEEGLSQECIEEHDNSEYMECMPVDKDLDVFKQGCLKIKTEKCQNFFKNPLEYFPHCKNFPKIQEYYSTNLMKALLIFYELKCQTDENGNFCPIAEALIKGEGDVSNTCKSKNCTDTAIKSFQQMDEEFYMALQNTPFSSGSWSQEEINESKNMVKVLESDNCRSQHITRLSLRF
ncbi:hypothetical protein BCR32DRAFT_264421 [Anaeromyces robustus]|uniref:Uncharacterized protein n=1 Tax=Anaeromyces robustus TaxID=1754192 RepID=A0A1Y1XNB4_9FUNG|nr:hypothetical protein BCR32DRAFT_264421 [Anaeromyces robustus]|eukprot:ORX87222.1 hypothetical protein BCR32DRAFT_264421 [Anaeromyces robustus]